MSGDRRNTGDMADDRRLTARLLNSAQTYCYTDDADPDFATVVMSGCVTTRPNEYPPKGHSYPRKDR
ncbi:hypothetical protein ACIO6U_31470 [Streptomyces sp. NPDC087422]|uniref:hypothetical protein n=1 Tax=Streptomyces sp. NPDC087422 TaxID=3365786 RepID=UPI00382C7BA5